VAATIRASARNQAGLGLQGHVADLVEEQGAAHGLLESTGVALGRAGEGALLVAKELAFDQLPGHGGHVDRHEGAIAALAVGVQRARHQFLAGSRTAVNHTSQVGAHEPRQDPVDLLHGRRPSDQGQALAVLQARLIVEPGQGLGLAGLGQGTLDRADQHA
jgi:hypothetical protein